MSTDRRVVITGMCVTAGNGKDKEEFCASLLSGKSGIRKCSVFPTEELRTPWFGEIEEKLIYEASSWSEQDRMEALMGMTLPHLYADASCTKEELKAMGSRACICVGSLLGHIGRLMAYAREEAGGQKEERWLGHCMDYIAWLKKNSGVTGGCYIDSAACASGTTAAGMAYDFIRNGIYDAALVGGADPLTEVAAWGFHALQSLSTGICRPFDQERDGINIGEGAAFFLFETPESAKRRNAEIYAEVLGYGLNNDAYHATSPDPSGAGAGASMREALSSAGIAPEQIDYINAHGTGTKINDAMECRAIREVFKEHAKDLAVNTTKALVGHCMGASGAVELSAVLLSMQKGLCAPMPGLRHPMEERGEVCLKAEGEERSIQYALSNSFAFAGNTASLLIGRFTG